MEAQQRGRSLSAGRQSNHDISHSHSPSPHQFHDYASHLNLENSVSNSTYNPPSFSPNGTSPVGEGLPYNLPAQYLENSLQPPPYQHHVLPSNDFGDLDQKAPYQHDNQNRNDQQRPSNLQPNHQFNPDILGSGPGNNFGDFETANSFTAKQGQGLDSTLLIDPQLGDMPQHQSINPADIMSNMSSPQNLIPTPPNLIPPETNSTSGPGSPATNQGQFYSPNHSRHPSTSLDPSSALNAGHQHGDWTGFTGDQFRMHRRAPSEHSDVSSSVAPSPFLPQHDSFDNLDQPSPMLNPQQDSSLYQDALGIGQFSISDPQQQQQQQQQQEKRISPSHTPYVSPRLSPQPGFGFSHDQFQPPQDMQNSYNGAPGLEIYTNAQEHPMGFPQRMGSGDMGQAAQMTPPEISVDLAPPSVPPTFDHPRPETDGPGLIPPERGRGGRAGRTRAKSDTSISRPMTPAGFPPDFSEFNAHRHRSLSPFDTSSQPSISREPSPAAKSRRSSTSSIQTRDYLIGLAGEPRPAGSSSERRVQKHPATFQCHLCPKRFTRAYNLRSHLRTHTDERPFVCTVCGKAFARQHDRKRHEGLHSGEKKFVCRGELGVGGNWGCGRRFARADALGRHFRSEAGRVCIKPLLDEEAMERARAFNEQMMQNQQGGGGGGAGGMGLAPPQQQPNWPAALLAQYPALQALQWDQLSGAGDDGADFGGSGRSSFDAGSVSGQEWMDDDGEGYMSGPGGGNYVGGGEYVGGGGSHDWASDYEGR